MEVLARDLKALGLYAARSLSFEGIEYEIVEHALTPEQVRIYDAYADAFQAIMVAFIVATAIVPLLRKVAMPKAPSADAH